MRERVYVRVCVVHDNGSVLQKVNEGKKEPVCL